MAASMDRQSKVYDLKVTSNDGVNPEDLQTLKPGAKDGLSGTNDTSPMNTSVSVSKMTPFGGRNADN